MKTITIPPNRPVVVALQDPSGRFDFDIGFGSYLTTAGEVLSLPRPAVVALNLIDPQPGEEIEIEQHQTGKPGEHPTWTVQLTHRSEMARAEAEGTPAPLEAMDTGNPAPEPPQAAVEPPTPIRRPAKPLKVLSVQPRLFDHTQHQPTCNACLLFDDKACNCGHDGTKYTTANPPRGTGTHGPAPASEPAMPAPVILPAAAIGRRRIEGQIPANIAVREILQFINSDPGTANWSDQARQDLASTVLIGFMKRGDIGRWERPQ